MKIKNGYYDVVIVGAGVTGAAAAFVLAKYTSVRSILIVEARSAPGTVNSKASSNSQTVHEGDIETNYSLLEAIALKKKAGYLRTYVTMRDLDRDLSQPCPKMVLGIGEKEVNKLLVRYQQLIRDFPNLDILDRREIGDREPNVISGRDLSTHICALASKDGLMVNYEVLAKRLLSDAQACNEEIEICFDTSVTGVHQQKDGYIVLETSEGTVNAGAALFAAGSYSLYFAHMIGAGKQYTMLPVAGSFFETSRALVGKVYRVQMEGIPFAAIHGDPDITDTSVTRLGPTTKPLPLMVRHHYKTILDFFSLYRGNFMEGVKSLFNVVYSRKLWWYIIKNPLFDVPVLGKWMFLKEARSIIPNIRYSDLKLRRGAGGIRPQLVDLKKRDLKMGDATIYEGKCIFNTTPSPGASVCLANALEYASKIVTLLGKKHTFNQEQWNKDFERSGS